jgi:riboflavin-specific deaminase-like protein
VSDAAIFDSNAAWRTLLALKNTPPEAGGERQVRDGESVAIGLTANGDWALHDATPTPEAAALMDRFVPMMAAPGHRYVIAQIAQSLDGRTATARGRGDRISGQADHQRLHQLRALVDAVVVGAGTALADSPRLTVRAVAGDQPARVVLDRSRRLPPDHPLLADPVSPALRVVEAPNSGDGAHTLAVPGMASAAILERLAERGLTRVLMEGGGSTVSRFLCAGCLDRLHLVIAPVLIGRGPAGLDLPPIDGMDQALRPSCRQHQLGDDVLFDLDLRRNNPPEPP